MVDAARFVGVIFFWTPILSFSFALFNGQLQQLVYYSQLFLFLFSRWQRLHSTVTLSDLSNKRTKHTASLLQVDNLGTRFLVTRAGYELASFLHDVLQTVVTIESSIVSTSSSAGHHVKQLQQNRLDHYHHGIIKYSYPNESKYQGKWRNGWGCW